MGTPARTYPTRTILARRWCRARRLGLPRREAPKATAGHFVLAGHHFDGAEHCDLSRVSRGALFVDLGVAQGGSGHGVIGRELGMFLVGSVLVTPRARFRGPGDGQLGGPAGHPFMASSPSASAGDPPAAPSR
jgi:hypothetical protein